MSFRQESWTKYIQQTSDAAVTDQTLEVTAINHKREDRLSITASVTVRDIEAHSHHT